MKTGRLMGACNFFGTPEISQEVYQLMKAGGLSDVEEYVLLNYLNLPVSPELRAAGQKATEETLKKAQNSIKSRFPKEVELPSA